jgi:hypothetical protein
MKYYNWNTIRMTTDDLDEKDARSLLALLFVSAKQLHSTIKHHLTHSTKHVALHLKKRPHKHDSHGCLYVPSAVDIVPQSKDVQ